MEMENSKLALAFLALTVIASGCAHTGGNTETEASTSPISINEFSAFPNPAPADQTVQFRMEVQNNGDVNAESVSAELFNPPFAGSSGESNSWRDGDSEGVSVGDRWYKFNNLRAPTENTPSVPKTKTKSFTAPNLEQGRTISYDFFSKIYYQYETNADTDIQVMSSQRFRDEGTTRSKPTLENSDGPIQMEIRTATPIVFYEEDTGGQRTSEMCVIVKNSGAGKPFIAQDRSDGNTGPLPDDVSPAYNSNNGRYSVNEGNSGMVWLEVQGAGNIEFDANGNNRVPVELIGGQGVQCYDMTATFGTAGNQIQQTVNVALTAQYGYTKETQTSVTVEGRGEGGNDDGGNGGGEGWSYKSRSNVPSEYKSLYDQVTSEEGGPASEICPGLDPEPKEALCTQG